MTTTSISFSGEACESFSDLIADRKGWFVRLTPIDGEAFDALIVDSGVKVPIDGQGWYDAVTFQRADDEGQVDEDAPVETLRVKDVYVY